LFLIAFIFIPVSDSPITEAADMGTMKISSPAFKHNEMIPSKYTCDGADVNPALVIEGVPAEAKSLALIMDDPDAPRGTWVHWVVWNVNPKIREIKENTVPDGGKQGINDFRKHDYGGPCPPSGTHRYFFKLYALDATLDLGPNATKAQLESAMKGHIIARTEMIGLYTRK
jgi:Raf kinase inhibitor-like YbhB/YbcL family protein